MAHDGGSGGAAAFFLLLGGIPAALLLLYLLAAMRAARSDWAWWRTASFGGGTACLLLAVSPPVTNWAHADLRGHMAQHLLLGMVGPIGLVFGAPVTLAFRSLPQKAGRFLVRLLAVGPVRIIAHPIVAALLNIGGMYVLYLTPLYAVTLVTPELHLALHIHFVLAGTLFVWSIAGPDPAPHRPSRGLRAVVLFLSTAAHALLGKIMYGYAFPRGTGADLDEIRAAAKWMYYGGDLAELALAMLFFAGWLKLRADAGRMPGRPGTCAPRPSPEQARPSVVHRGSTSKEDRPSGCP